MGSEGDSEARDRCPIGTPATVPEPWRLGERELIESVVRVSREIERLEALRVTLVGEVEAHCTSEVLGFGSTKLWLTATTLLQAPAAGRLVCLAWALRIHPRSAPPSRPAASASTTPP